MASITFCTATLFFASASSAVWPWVSTPNVNSASSGLAVTVPTPLTVMPSAPPADPLACPCAASGRPTPAHNASPIPVSASAATVTARFRILSMASLQIVRLPLDGRKPRDVPVGRRATRPRAARR
jgi:hypothetical protein